MALESASVWADTLNNLPKVTTPDWTENIAQAIFDLTSNKLQIQDIEPPSVFTFQKPIFQAVLATAVPAVDPVTGATTFSNAWRDACAASVMFVASGSSYVPGGVPPSPANTFSAPPAVVVDPPSLLIGYNILFTAIATGGGQPNADYFAEQFRDAFLALTYTVTGVNSVTPTPGPLVIPFAPVE